MVTVRQEFTMGLTQRSALVLGQLVDQPQYFCLVADLLAAAVEICYLPFLYDRVGTYGLPNFEFDVSPCGVDYRDFETFVLID